MSLSSALDTLEAALSSSTAAEDLARSFGEVAQAVLAEATWKLRLHFQRLMSVLSRIEETGRCHLGLPLIAALRTRVFQSAFFSRAEINEVVFGYFLFLGAAHRYDEALRLAEELHEGPQLPPLMRRALAVHIGSLESVLGKPEAVSHLRAAVKDLASSSDDDDMRLHAKASLDLARTITESGGDPREAEHLLRTAMPAIARYFGGTVLEAFNHDVLGRALSLQGDYARAREEFQRAREIVGRSVGTVSATYVTALLNLATVFFFEGAYHESEKLLDDADAIVRELGDDDPELIMVLHHRMGISAHTGDDDGAERYATKLLERLNTVAFHAAFRGGALLELGDVARRRGDYTAARRNYEAAEPLLAGTPFADLATRSIALLDVFAGNFDAALERYTYVAAAEQSRGSEDTIEHAHTLLGLARISLARKAWTEALALAERALDVAQMCCGSKSVDLVEPLRIAACAYVGLGKYAEASRRLHRAAGIEHPYLLASLPLLPNSRQIELLRSFRATLEMALSIYLDYAPADPTCARVSREIALGRKGLYVQMARQGRTDESRLSEHQRDLLKRRTVINRILTEQAVRPVFAGIPRPSREAIDSLTEELHRIEKSLATVIAPIARPSLEGVAAALASDMAYIDYVAYSTLNPQNGSPEGGIEAANIAAFWIMPDRSCGAERIQFLARFNDRLEELVSALLQERASATAREVYEVLLGKLPRKVIDARHLRISPDGLVWLISFSLLAKSSTRLVIDDSIVTYVDSAYELLHRTNGPARQGVVIVANPNFYAEIDEESDYEGWHPLDVAAVPGGEDELSALKALFPNAEIWQGTAATKSAMLAGLHGPVLLHVTTHGEFIGPSRSTSRNVRGTDTLLLLAGFNHGSLGVRYGALSALEAQSLDLGGTELATLSACVTGLGKVEPAQGVMSLRTALQIAGARSQLVSLWPVPGEATAHLMKKFYEGVCSGQSREAALCDAQREMAAIASPYFWAGFVLFGMIGPIANRLSNA
jgi:CHAT domain-containing protein